MALAYTRRDAHEGIRRSASGERYDHGNWAHRIGLRRCSPRTIAADYKIQDNKFHVVGPSNGGIAAFHVAAALARYSVEQGQPHRLDSLAGASCSGC